METIAIVGATVIDGTGASPLPDAVVLIRGKHIERVGRSRTTRVPADARVIDGRGLFLLPGFIDVNVHISADTAVAAILRTAHSVLRSGVTTMRDSWGSLGPLRHARDSINAGHVLGARLLVAGNIVGWGSSGSLTFSLTAVRGGTPDEALTQGVGEELVNLDADSLRVVISQYLDKGVDFLKYGSTLHSGDDDASFVPNLIVFSDRAQRVLVEEAHKRGLVAETHATSPEGLRMALLAGVDLVQHPEVMSTRYVLSDELVQLMVRRKVICAIIGGRTISWPNLPPTTRRNAEKLIRAGCIVAVASDLGGGESTLASIRALVKLGMTPMEALVAATRNGALASRMLDRLGTIEAGKLADLVLLRDDPLQNIEHVTSQKIAFVLKEGSIVVTPEDVRQAAWDAFLQKTTYVRKSYTAVFHGLALSKTQTSSLKEIFAAHDAQWTLLMDSLRTNAAMDTVRSSRRAQEVFAQHLDMYRELLPEDQRAAFDAKTQKWR